MTVVVQTVLNNSKHLVLSLYVTGANIGTTIYDATSMDDNLSLEVAQWSLTGDNATIAWDATADNTAVRLSVGSGCMEFDPNVPNPQSAGFTNDIKITNGAGVTSGSVYLKFRKN